MSFPEGKGGTHTVIIGHGGRRFLQLAQSRITDEKGFGGPFLWRVSSKGPASMHEDASDLPLLPSCPRFTWPGPPFLHLSLLPPIESCTPRRPRFRSSFFRSLDTYPFVSTISFFLFSLRDIIGCMISFWELFFSRTLIDDTWVIDVWPDSSVNFLRFLTVVGLIYFDWWIYFSFFFLGREKESKLDRVQVISDFRSLSCL